MDTSDFFGAEGPLAGCLPGFQPRPGQAIMADAVARALSRQGKLIVEAGTGTGKTFAYLVPVLTSGARTIVSTGTRALQDQLYHRDLPLIGRALGRPVRTALLKGRANYLCLERLERAAGQPMDPELAGDLRAVERWRHRSLSGDRAELSEVAEDSRVWPLVTSTAESCLGRKCPHFRECHVVKARRAAQEADLVVVNHHLLLADLALKEEGFVEFLPGVDAIVLDEAHQLPDLATRFFGTSLGSRDLERLLDEARALLLATGQRESRRRLVRTETAVGKLRAAAPRREGRYELAELSAALAAPLAELRSAVSELGEAIAAAGDTPALDALAAQAEHVGERLACLADEEAAEGLRWLQVNPRSLRLHLTPLDISGTFGPMMDAVPQAWVFTSATLAVGEDFSHFIERLGIDDAECLALPSPYRLAEHGLVYLPPGLPRPSESGHTAAMLDAVMPLLTMTSGGVFCLFTSLRALGVAREWCREHAQRLAGRPLLVQGEAPRDDLLRRFRRHGNAVLLGSGSFWEGVDVRGGALTVVAIDKLPFASPADPQLKARLAFIRRAGGNPFAEHQLPQAALALKQGAGRLLRDAGDHGVVVLCDPRITEKAYGRLFLDCLAPMPGTPEIEEVRRFLARHEAGAPAAEARPVP